MEKAKAKKNTTKTKTAAKPKAVSAPKAKAEMVKAKKSTFEAPVYDMSGKKVRDFALSETLFGAA